MCSCEEGGSLNDFKFGTSVGRFTNDGAASRAVKGLNLDESSIASETVIGLCLFLDWKLRSLVSATVQYARRGKLETDWIPCDNSLVRFKFKVP